MYWRQSWRRDSRNASKPPSTDGLKRKPKPLREPGGKQQGGQPGHKGKTLKRVQDPDRTEIHPVAAWCDACGEPLASDPLTLSPETRQVVDLPAIRFEVTVHRVQIAQCHCGKAHSGQFPAGVDHAVQSGAHVRAAAVRFYSGDTSKPSAGNRVY
ncbi:DUF6444 domain-containing protein [Cupriavidus basilensis]|uniref:DUF6444 domain-containing protein n=1 Tax=Cupriavidus basilensis TaxID=68895 RepID=UPI0023E889EB|nr:DUF6444 domain-containing protein [Cupriavidus basilensis]MDF3880947.1 DUF6444 domain-containing protein [Cupriavidus basilensis]